MTQEELDAEKARQISALKEWEQKRSNTVSQVDATNQMRITIKAVAKAFQIEIWS